MKLYKIYFLLLTHTIFINLSSAFGQLSKTDSLILDLKSTMHDTLRCRTLSQIITLSSVDFNVWPTYNEQLKNLCEKNLITATGELRKVYLINLAQALNRIGYHASLNGDIKKALEYFNKSLKIKETINDLLGVSNTLQNIAIEYYRQGEVKPALEYFDRCIKIQEELGDKESLSMTLQNMGTIYFKQKNIDKSYEYFTRCIKIREELGVVRGNGILFSNIASIYELRGDNKSALDSYNKGLKISYELEDVSALCMLYNRLGIYYLKNASSQKTSAEKNKFYNKALLYSDSAHLLSKQLGFPEALRNAEQALSRIDSARGNYAGAFEHFKQHIKYRDSLLNESTRKASLKSQLKYEYEKKEAVLIEQQEKEKTLAEEKNQRQQIVIWSVVAGFILVVVFAAFIFKSLKTTRAQKIIIEAHQKEIIDSIYYAKRIQTSLLPTEKYIERVLKKFLASLFLFSVLSASIAYAQQNTQSNLLKILNSTQHDSVKLRQLCETGATCDPEDILTYSLPGSELAEKLLANKSAIKNEPGYEKKILVMKAQCLNNSAYIYNLKGNVTRALDYYNQSLRIFELTGQTNDAGILLQNVAYIFIGQKDFKTALTYLEKSRKHFEAINDKKNIIMSLNNTALIYKNNRDIKNALIYLEKALNINDEIRDVNGIGTSLNNIGVLYKDQGETTKALYYFNKSLVLYKKEGYKKGIATSLLNIGLIKRKVGEFNDAFNYMKQSLALYEELQDTETVSVIFNSIVALFYQQKKYKLALNYADSSLLISKKLGYPVLILNSELWHARLDSCLQNYESAYHHYKQFVLYQDSTLNEQTRKAGIKSQLKYEFEKREAVMLEHRENERTVAQEKNRRQKMILASVSFGLITVILFALFIFRTLKTTRKQKIIIEEHQKEIIDSIRYAKRIQTSLLPTHKYIERILKTNNKN